MNSYFYDPETDRFSLSENEEKFSLLTACLHVGYKCNLSCPYCFNQYENEKIISAGENEVVDRLKSLGIKRLVISGGEPFIYQDQLEILLKRAKFNNIITLVSTNGTLADKKSLDRLLDYLDWVDVSIPATDSKTYFDMRKYDGFDKVCENVKLLIEKGAKVRLTFTVSKENLSCVNNLKKLVKNLGVNNVRIGYVYGDNGLIDELFDLEHVVKELEKDNVFVYRPISGELFEAYKKGYLVVRLDGAMYLNSPTKENFVANIFEKGINLEQTFSKIADYQRKLFCR